VHCIVISCQRVVSLVDFDPELPQAQLAGMVYAQTGMGNVPDGESFVLRQRWPLTG